jgi:serine/threonine protein phosphatase PrpC
MVASLVDETLQSPWSSSCEDLGGRLVLAIQAAARRLFMHSAADPRSAGMGTTATLVAAVDNHLQLAHIGDTRAYLFRGGELTQVSSDHTLINLLLQKGQLKPEEIDDLPRNVIVRALGMSASVEIDAHAVEVQPGDVVLLCSDGVSKMISDAQISAILFSMVSPEIACDALIDAAEHAGGHDNQTAILLVVCR